MLLVSLVPKLQLGNLDSHLTAVESVYGGCGIPRHTLHIIVPDFVAVSKAQIFDFTELKTTLSRG